MKLVRPAQGEEKKGEGKREGKRKMEEKKGRGGRGGRDGMRVRESEGSPGDGSAKQADAHPFLKTRCSFPKNCPSMYGVAVN